MTNYLFLDLTFFFFFKSKGHIKGKRDTTDQMLQPQLPAQPRSTATTHRSSVGTLNRHEI